MISVPIIMLVDSHRQMYVDLQWEQPCCTRINSVGEGT